MSLFFHFIALYCIQWMMAMFLKKCLNSMCYVTIVFDPSACRIWWRFHWDGFVGRLLRFVPAAWPCRRFCLGPQCCSLPGRHCCKQLIELHGSDDRAMTCLWILVAYCGNVPLSFLGNSKNNRSWRTLWMIEKAHLRGIWGGCRSVQFDNRTSQFVATINSCTVFHPVFWAVDYS